ncbi:unnamed protein product [Polarella glacialis]|uniref:IF140/IFT172/WDR19 TPR domain-containing protein n=1 Tax=Polarella glacialis TaxID=89957 RepID=A0A813J582_POLGL|nr:unnamed protein product [Polarella glacialis]
MLRLVSKYRKELLNDTYKHIAEQYEMKGNLKKAEHYYVEAKMWTSAMSMYRQLEKWEDAKRVAKVHGGKSSFEKVVLAQAHATFKEHGAEAGAQLLAKHGLIEIAIDYAVEHSNFQHAFELATHSAKHKLPDIHLKKALALEDDEQFKLAEEEFIKAVKPKEAIDMYVHQRDWVSAMRVAEAYDRDGIKDVMVHHAKDLVDQNNLQAAENLFIQAGKPDLAVQAYKSKRMVNEAIRVCKKHCPHMLGDVVDSYSEGGSGAQGVLIAITPPTWDPICEAKLKKRGATQSLEEVLDAAKIYEETGNYSRAIDTYLSVDENSTADPDRLEEVWENAVRLAMKHAQERYNEIVAVVAKRLKMIQRFEAEQLGVEVDLRRFLMDLRSATSLLRRSARTRTLQLQVVPGNVFHSTSSCFDSALCDSLYDFSRKLSLEPRSHWQAHADTNAELHVLRCEGGEIQGFQMWNWGPSLAGPTGAIVLRGGKLRFGDPIRRLGLHVMSNLVAVHSARTALSVIAGQRVYRAGIVNVHAFSSYFEALASFQTLPFTTSDSSDSSLDLARVGRAELAALAQVSGYRIDARTGRIDVGQRSPFLPEDFGDEWWNRPGVQVFRRLGLASGADFSPTETLSRQNDVGICFELDDANVTAMSRFIQRKLELHEAFPCFSKRVSLVVVEMVFEAAAELYESIEAAREAVNCYIAGEVWEKAKLLAQQQCPDMVRVVEERYKSDLVNKGDGDELIRRTGDVDSALDMYARNGDWTKCLTLAEKHSPKMLPHYLVQYCKILANKGDILEACETLVRYGPPTEQSNFQLYKAGALQLMSGDSATGPALVREMLLKVVTPPGALGSPPTPKTLADDRSPQAAEFTRALLAAHLQMTRQRFRENNKAPEMVAKISVALCRYCAEFPVDRAFYDAGLECKNAGMINMSFFFLNRFLDIADAIDDPENAAIDNTDFMETDIPSPYASGLHRLRLADVILAS